MLVIALTVSAQRPQITDRLNNNGQVTVDAPKELVKRNNADLNNNGRIDVGDITSIIDMLSNLNN